MYGTLIYIFCIFHRDKITSYINNARKMYRKVIFLYATGE